MSVVEQTNREVDASVVLRDRRPLNRHALRDWLNMFAHLELPERAVVPGHATPLDYLAHVFFEGRENGSGDDAAGVGGDAVVWACRGGGKTTLGAAATMLDLVFKPGIQIRILGGSLEQSQKMFAALRQLFGVANEDLLAAPPTRRRLTLKNGSRCEIVAQSEKAVRGMRVQKVRCDEVELFDRDVWKAVQLTTRSMGTDDARGVARGSVEAFSTMHKPHGLMREALDGAAGAGRTIFKWCIFDVIEKCPESRKCEGCLLWNDCQGRAKQAQGFVPVEDVIGLKRRVSRNVWEHEMMCLPPKVERAVFGAFAAEKHGRSWPGGGAKRGERVMVDGRALVMEGLAAGVDFGFAEAFVCLWVMFLRDELGRRVAWVVDELVTQGEILRKNVQAMKQRGAQRPWELEMVYCDVAGKGANSQTGRTDERVVREAGFVVKSSAMAVEEGIGIIEEMIDPAEGAVRLLVDPRCVRLVEALSCYARDEAGMAVKDGRQDHLVDALRYAVVNEGRSGVRGRRY